MSLGKISQVVGPVVDVAFSVGDKLPEINNALVVYKNDQQKSKVVLEVALTSSLLQKKFLKQGSRSLTSWPLI